MIDDLLRVMRKGPETMANLDALRFNNRSIARGANDATFQFPVLMSNTIPIDMAATIARTMEKTYVAFTRTWLSLNPTIDITLDRNILQYLKRFHQNVSLESVDDVIHEDNRVRLCDGNKNQNIVAESGEQYVVTNRNKSFVATFSEAAHPSYEMIQSHREYSRPFMSDFDLNPIPYVGMRPEPTVTTEADDGVTEQDLFRAAVAGKQAALNRTIVDGEIKKWKEVKSPQLTDSEAKKANDIMPYALQVRLMAVNDKNEFVQYMDAVIGVKAMLHPIASDDILDNIQRVMRNQNPFFKFLRWTSGEISLVKNLILNLDEIREDVLNREAGRSPWFGKLRRLRSHKVGLRDFTSLHMLVPNSTLVISSYEADYLKDNYSIDVTDARVAKRLIDAMFLMAFIVVDDGNAIVDILYEGSADFQSYSLETLEREVSMNSNKLGREIGRMISR